MEYKRSYRSALLHSRPRPHPPPLRYFLLDTRSWHSEYAYALVNPICFSNLVIAHEFGHNFGCDHNREHAAEDQDYAHGYRYCSGRDM